jgi:hypothetical protein
MDLFMEQNDKEQNDKEQNDKEQNDKENTHTHPQIMSIDVGIKNLAYCILECNQEKKTYKIIDWNVINLCSEDAVCNQIITNKNNKQKQNNKQNKSKGNKSTPESTINIPLITYCDKKAKFYKNNDNFCIAHAKASSYIIPSADDNTIKFSTIKKKKIEELKTIIQKYNITLDNDITYNRDMLLDKVITYLNANLFNKIENNNSASDMDLVSMGISLQLELNKIMTVSNITNIIIENQISPIANRMKTLQGMIAQYFIMNNKKSIIFASSINKLKPFVLPGTKTVYKDRKKLGVNITREIIKLNKDNDESFSVWYDTFNIHKKKDDLADSFLQGLWFIQKEFAIKNDYILSI